MMVGNGKAVGAGGEGRFGQNTLLRRPDWNFADVGFECSGRIRLEMLSFYTIEEIGRQQAKSAPATNGDAVNLRNCYHMMDMSIWGCNRDGAALRYVAEHLVKRPEYHKLLILISYGQSSDDGYFGTGAEADLRGIRREYRNKGVTLFAAAIGDDRENIERI